MEPISPNLQSESTIQIYTLGDFRVLREGQLISSKDWGRDKTVQLLQFLISNRSRSALHKEQIIDRLWFDAGDRDFKVAMHGINKALEPGRPSRTDPKYIVRNGLSYYLNTDKLWIDIDYAEKLIIEANNCAVENPSKAISIYQNALSVYKGTYLPNRTFEDWTSEERERMQILFIGAYTDLAKLMIDQNPTESIRLTQSALQIDATWEDAYRIQMEAYIKKGNRPMALKTYDKCKNVLNDQYGLDPLPITKSFFDKLISL